MYNYLQKTAIVQKEKEEGDDHAHICVAGIICEIGVQFYKK